jgi:hypothetical protein
MVVLVAGFVVLGGGNVHISTGVDDSSSWVLSARAPAAACCGLLCAVVDGWFAPAEAMAAGISSSHDVSGDSDGNGRSK